MSVSSINLVIFPIIYPPLKGGASIYFSMLVDYLDRSDRIESITIITRHTKGHPIKSKNGKITILRILPYFFQSKYTLFLSNILSIILVFLIGLFQKKMNLVHYHAHASYYKGIVMACKIKGIKSVADIQGPVHSKNYVNADYVITCSENTFVKALECGFNKDKIKMVHLPFTIPKKSENHCTTRIMQNRFPQNSKYICFIGDIVSYKGIFELIEAFQLMQENGSDYYLVIAGERITEEEYNKFEALINKNRKIIYLGPLEHDEVLIIMQASELVILPSKSEGLPRVCLEAIALEKKVVCPNVVPEFKKHCPEFVVEEIKPEVIARTIEKILDMEYIPKYPFENHLPQSVFKKTFQVYEFLLSNNGNRIRG